MKLVDKVTFRPPPAREKLPFAAESDPASAPQIPDGSDRKVLVVDDNAIVLKVCELKLKGSGFKVVTARDASNCLGAAREEAPDAIVLDLNFPVGDTFTTFNWDGVQILRWLKHCKEVENVPVIILTGDDTGKNKQLVMTEGAAAYFQKPVDWKLFVAELLKLIGNKPPA